MDFGLSGRTAIVTGSHRGTGTGIARVLAREGARVWIHGFELEPAEQVVVALRGEGLDAGAGEPTDWPSVASKISRKIMPNPAGLVADPEDIGHLVAFLASDEARCINGTNLRIDGGAVDSTV